MTVGYFMTNETYFQLEGEFLGVCALDGYKLKYLRLRTVDSPQQRDVVIKVPKELRAGLVYQLASGDRIRCEGIQKDLKFKASAIEKVVDVASPVPKAGLRPTENRVASAGENRFNDADRFSLGATEPTRSHSADRSKVKILICQKSHCFNNGGKEIYSALTEQLNNHHLNDSVTVKLTGCLKCCKQAPNMVVLPDRSSYHNVKIAQIPAIVSKVRHHLTTDPK
jgi:(2Fe-2S) ferredoxin